MAMSNKRGSGMRSSVSADDVGSATKKPGKLSADFIAKFESDSAFGGSTGAIPKRVSHASSSEMGSTSASHEHLQSIKPHVKISEPVGRDEEGTDDKNEKKRKSKWKWNPLKKMRRFFSRKKGSRRTKSYEDLPTESYRPKSTSDDRLDEHGKYSPVVRTSTMPPNTKAPVVRELRDRHTSSSDDLGASCDSFASKTRSLPVLTSPGQLRDYAYTEEAGISFESDPNSSSLEGLQAARDKIKAAPKRRRPPSRNRSGSATSSLSADSPVRKEPRTPHRRSKTDPKDLTRDTSFEASSSLSDILSNTIFEEEEAAKSPPGTVKEKPVDKPKAAMDDITSRVNEAMARTTGPSKLAEREVKSTPKKDDSNIATLTKTEAFVPSKFAEREVKSAPKKDESNRTTLKNVDASGPSKFSERELKTKEELTKTETSLPSKFAEREVKSTPKKDESNRTTLTKTETSGPSKFAEREVKTKEELTKTETSIPLKFAEREVKSTPKKEEFSRTTSTKTDTPNAKVTVTSSTTSDVKRETKRLSLDDKTRTSFTESIVTSKSDSDILRAEFTTLLQSDPSDSLWRDEKNSGERSMGNSSKETTTQSQRPNSQDKPPQITPKPFKRGKSWSNSHTPKLIEFPIKQDKEKSKNESTNGNTSGQTNKEESGGESTTPFSEKKDFRFSRTKSWSYGTKPGDVVKANEGLQSKESTKTTSGSSDDVKEGPSWVAKANRMSQRISQLMEDDDNSENQTPTLRKKSKDSEQSKHKTPSKPVVEDHVKPKPLTNKPNVDQKPNIISPKPTPAPRPKPSTFVRSSAALPRIGGSAPSSEAKPVSSTANSRNESTKKTDEPKTSVQQVARSSFGNVKIEKCIICGTTVYQMEKCKFDDSVLHRNCIKCSVCKRHLTVGNFVMTESKIYCKPHSQAVVAVST